MIGGFEQDDTMRTIKITSWKDNDFYVGYLNDYPDYRSQGLSKEELVENLKELLQDIESDEVPYIRSIEEMVVA
jgi:predicted RNase H-like HicB family nuclease